MKKGRYNPYSTRNAFYTSLAIALFQYLLMTTTSLLSFPDRGAVSPGSILFDLAISYTGTVILLLCLFRFSFWMMQQRISSLKKYLINFFGLILFAGLLSLLFSGIFESLLTNPAYLEHTVYKKLMQDISFALIVFLISVSIESLMRNQKLEAENMRNRYDALKNQLDPHFLFNSLNALDGLIGYDDEKAHDYLQNLSFTFRQVIQNKEINDLDEELKLANAYFYLMKIRYGDNLEMETRIDDRYRSWMTLPVSLQLLIENAIKHNAVNDKYPLRITIETTNHHTIKVSNNKNPKIAQQSDSGIGLANLAERFLLITHREIRVKDSAESFSVEVPLIEQIKE